jgi:rusticyanin
VIAVISIALVLAVGGGLGIGLTVSSNSSSSPSTAGVQSSYRWYQSMMGQFAGNSGSMMGGSVPGSMMGSNGYRWMMGGTNTAPGWMNGGSLPSYMMGTNTDPGKVMGRLFANAPGPRVAATDAVRLGNAIPAGATVDHQANRVTFTSASVRMTVVASPPGSPDETFRIAGLTNPTIVVRQGSAVSMVLINADPDTAHGLVVTSVRGASSWMPMMSAAPAFFGAALWSLGYPTAAGLHKGTLDFTASTTGTYQYLCPVPGHAQKGMVGTFVVTSS